MVVVEKKACSCLFVHDVLSFRQTPPTRLSIKESGRFVIYYVKF